jgi:hypothetical protein
VVAAVTAEAEVVTAEAEDVVAADVEDKGAFN